MSDVPNAAVLLLLEQQRKSVGLAFVLALFFGPLGLLYAAPIPGAVLCGLFLIFGWLVLPLVVIGWIACPFWALIAASNHNDRLARLVASQGLPRV